MKYLIDTCKGTKYYKTLKGALKAFNKDKTAHTMAENINGIWIIINIKTY